MANTPIASPSHAGFKMASLSPEELDKFAALFVPSWEAAAADAPAAAPDPGFSAAKVDAGLAAQLSPHRARPRWPWPRPRTPRPR